MGLPEYRMLINYWWCVLKSLWKHDHSWPSVALGATNERRNFGDLWSLEWWKQQCVQLDEIASNVVDPFWHVSSRKGGINGYRVPMEWVPVSAASCQSSHSPLHQTSTLSTHIPNTNWTAYHCDMLTLSNSCMAFMPVWQDNQFTIAELDVIRKFVPSAVFKQIEDGTLTYVNEMRLLGWAVG